MDPVLMNYWYPVAKASDVQEAPVAVELLGEQVVVFRTSDGVHAFEDLCIHRGSALSLGRVENDTLVCVYHGWAYDCTGQCVRIPSQPAERGIPQKARVVAYHCAERHGLIWVCLGDPKGAIANHPEYDRPDYRTVLCGPYPMQASPTRLMENLIDIPHLMWVHDGILGDSKRSEIPDHTVTRHENGFASSELVFYQPNPMGLGTGATSLVSYDIVGPFTVRFHKRTVETAEEVAVTFTVMPQAEHRSTMFVVRSRNYGLDDPDEKYVAFQTMVTMQDVPVVQSQRPERLPLDLSEELHLKSDRLAVEYRRWLRELGVTMAVR